MKSPSNILNFTNQSLPQNLFLFRKTFFRFLFRSFNSEVFKTFLREEKRNELMKRRHNLATTSTSSSTSSTTSSATSSSTSSFISSQSIDTQENLKKELKIEKNSQIVNLESDPSSESNSPTVRNRVRTVGGSHSNGGAVLIKRENKKGKHIIYTKADVGVKAAARHQKVCTYVLTYVREYE